MIELNQQRLALAEALGEDPERIRASAPRWLELMQQGVLVSLHIGRWRAKTRLTWEDLGIQLDAASADELQKVIDLGHKKLLPDDLLRELDAAESGARKWLEKKAYRTYWGCFVPVTAYATWKEGNQEYRERYFALRDRTVRGYQSLLEEVLDSYRLAATGAYQRLRALNPAALGRFPDREDFVSAFVDGVQSHVWPAAEISRSFYFETELRYVPLPGLMAEEQARQQQADLQAQLERDRFYTERERLQAELRAARSAGEWQERRLQEMNRDVLAQAQRQKEELVDGFLRDIVVQLRTLVYQATTDVLAAIQKNEGLPPRSVAQLNNLVRQVQALNFYGDEDVEAMVNKIAFTLGQQAPARDVFSFEQNLRDIATVVRASLVSLGEQPRGARMLGVADEPTPDVVRRARRSLELERGSADTLDLGAPAFRQPRLLELAAG